MALRSNPNYLLDLTGSPNLCQVPFLGGQNTPILEEVLENLQKRL